MQSQAPGALVQRFGRRALADRWHCDRQKVAGGTHVVSCKDAEDHGAGLRAIPLQKRRCPGLCQRTRDGSLVRRLVGLLSNGVPPTQGRFRNVFTQTATPHMRDSPTLAEMLTCGRNAGICKHLRHNLDGWSLLLGMSVSASLCAALLLIHQVNKFR